MSSLFKRRPRQIQLTIHITDHSEMELNYRIIGKFCGALLSKLQRLRIVATFVKNPAKRVSDSAVTQIEIVCFLRQIVGLIKLIELFAVKVSKIVKCQNRARAERKDLQVGITRGFIVFHLLVNERRH